MLESTAIFSVEVAGRTTKRTSSYTQGEAAMPSCVLRSTGVHTRRMVQLPEAHPVAVRPIKHSS